MLPYLSLKITGVLGSLNYLIQAEPDLCKEPLWILGTVEYKLELIKADL
jgi:hypothetical protein